jgi:hypothetical protein
VKLSVLLLIASIIVGIGGWMVTLQTWQQATNPVPMGGLLMIIGGVLCAWLGQSPLKGKQP